MNKTEARYAQGLSYLVKTGDLVNWEYESIKFRLGERCWYTPDFLLMYPDRFEVHETKGGFVRDDSLVKFKAAAEKYPTFIWRMMQWAKGEWRMMLEL